MSKKWMVRGISCYLFFMAWYVWGLIQADAAEPGITVTVTQEGYVQVGIDSRELGNGEISVICYEPGWNQDPGDWSGNQAYLTYVNQYTLKDGKASFGFPVKGEKKDGEYALVVGTGSGTFVQAFPQQEEEVRYTVTYAAGKGGKIKGTAVQKVEAGGTGEEVTAVPDTGYRFLAWDDGILNASRRETEVGKDQTHTALFQKIEAEEYMVTFHPNGGETATKERMVKKGEPVGALPKAIRTGYRLLGWFTAKEGGKQITSATRVSSPMDVYAQWIRLAPAKGTKFSHGDLKYQIVKAASSVKHTGTVSVLGAKTKKKHVSIPAKVKWNGYTYRVETVAKRAFRNHNKMETLKIGSGIRQIQAEAFYNCTRLKTVSIGKDVEILGEKAFMNDKSLTSVVIGNGVKTLGNQVFRNNKSLKRVVIGKNVAFIGSKVFMDDKKLKGITFTGKKLKSVGKSAFRGIAGNARIKVPRTKYNAYRKLLKNKGQKKTVVIQKK